MFYVYISRSVSQLKPFFGGGGGGVADGELQDFKEFHTNSGLAVFLLDRYVCILHVCVWGMFKCPKIQGETYHKSNRELLTILVAV